MSELLQSDSKKLESLYSFAKGLINGGDGRLLIEKYRKEIDEVTPYETMHVFHRLLEEGLDPAVLKDYTGKILNVFYKSLAAFKWEKPSGSHFLHYMMLENREAERIIKEMRTVIKEIYHGDGKDEADLFVKLKSHLARLKEYELHYIKKENILFPYLEKAFPHYKCIQIMWSFHDDYRKSTAEIEKILSEENPDKNLLNTRLGKLFFVVLPIIFREEQIVYPMAVSALPGKAWDEMLEQGNEAGWCYISPPESKLRSPGGISSGTFTDLKSGLLKPEQIVLLLNNLPVDITFVDENDQVVYFSAGKHRIFPRSNAIIGRKVQNCHPPDSVHIVNEIVDSFRKGLKDEAEFWINSRGRFIHIRYFALRDEQEVYRGVIEVSQDVTSIRSLEGERRLLDW